MLMLARGGVLGNARRIRSQCSPLYLIQDGVSRGHSMAITACSAINTFWLKRLRVLCERIFFVDLQNQSKTWCAHPAILIINMTMITVRIKEMPCQKRTGFRSSNG